MSAEDFVVAGPPERRQPAEPSTWSNHAWGLAWRIVAMALAIGAAIWLAITLRQIVLQLLMAVILACGLLPPVEWLRARGAPRGLAVLLIYLAFILLAVGLGFLVIPPVLHQVEVGIRSAPEYGDRVAEGLRSLQTQFPFLTPLDEQVVAVTRNVGAQLGAIASQALLLARFALGFFSGLLSAVLVLLITLYLVVDGTRIREYLLGFVSPTRRPRLRLVMDRMGVKMGGWLIGEITLMLAVGTVSYIGLTLLGVQGALLLAVLAGIGEAIPIVGPIGSAIPAVLVASTQSPLLAGLTILLYVIIQQLENNLLVPKIMERAVNLHPLAVVLSLLIGIQLLGVLGAIVAVPVTAALSEVLDEVRQSTTTESRPIALPAAPLPPNADPGK